MNLCIGCLGHIRPNGCDPTLVNRSSQCGYQCRVWRQLKAIERRNAPSGASSPAGYGRPDEASQRPGANRDRR